MVQGIAQALLNLPLGLGRLHVDEVDDNQATQVAQSKLAADLVGCLQVGAQGGLFDVRALGGACRVNVDCHQGLGVVDDQGTTGG